VKRLAFEYWTPVLLWLLVIFVFSTDLFAANRTSGIIAAILRTFFPWMSSAELGFWHAVVRKSAHIAAYFILTVLTYRSLRQVQPDIIETSLRTLSFVAFAAASDEIHQSFTLFRTASPIDVGYDCIGAVCALWLIITYEARRLRPYPIL
jgi:VanZ family protein